MAYLDWKTSWASKRRANQIPPPGDWNVWNILAGRGFGKALALDTLIPTPSGWTTMGKIQDGAEVFDENGQVARVVQVHQVMLGRPCFKVSFSDGSAVVCDGDHLWRTEDHEARKGRRGQRVRTTIEIAETLKAGREVNHVIPTASALDLPDAHLPIDPYVLGAWLGDGTSVAGEITTVDLDVLAEIEKAGEVVAFTRHAGGLSKTYSLSAFAPLRSVANGRFEAEPRSLTSRLTTLGVLRNKHVPLAYLRASASQRLDLLQGMMDTDGHINATGNAEFCSTSKALADAVFELMVSLGLKPGYREDRATLYGKDCGPRYRVTVTPYIPIFRLPRKAVRVKRPGAQSGRQLRRYIVNVEPVASVPVRYITVDSPSRLYLCSRAMIPTHNTRVGAETLSDWAITSPDTRWLVAGPTSGDVRGVCFEGESGLLAVIPPELVVNYNKSLLELTVACLDGGTSLIKGISAEEPERFRGVLSAGAQDQRNS